MRHYRYVGPAEIAAGASTSAGRPIRTALALAKWGKAGEAYTYVVDVVGVLRLAPRRSEHVACAAGDEVLAAGEMTFDKGADGWAVTDVTNQSTGYCPEPSCWPAVAEALEHAGIGHPSRFTAEFVFRRCPDCAQLNIVKNGVFACDVCGADLPAEWNVGG